MKYRIGETFEIITHTDLMRRIRWMDEGSTMTITKLGEEDE